MTSWRDEDGQDEKKPVQVVISDKRHSRDLETEAGGHEAGAAESAEAESPAEPAPEAPSAAQPEAEPAAAPAESAVLDFPAAQHSPAEHAPGGNDAALLDAEHAFGHGPAAADEHEAGSGLPPELADMEGAGELSPDEQMAAAAEMAQLRQVFAGGLSRYLQAQLGLLLNFALIGLGRAPDPSTGLVAPNLNQSRLAIDVLEFLVLRLEPDLHPQDREQLKQLVADLKYAFMQAVAGPGAAGGGPAGPAPGGLA